MTAKINRIKTVKNILYKDGKIYCIKTVKIYSIKSVKYIV